MCAVVTLMHRFYWILGQHRVVESTAHVVVWGETGSFLALLPYSVLAGSEWYYFSYTFGRCWSFLFCCGSVFQYLLVVERSTNAAELTGWSGEVQVVTSPRHCPVHHHHNHHHSIPFDLPHVCICHVLTEVLPFCFLVLLCCWCWLIARIYLLTYLRIYPSTNPPLVWTLVYKLLRCFDWLWIIALLIKVLHCLLLGCRIALLFSFSFFLCFVLLSRVFGLVCDGCLPVACPFTVWQFGWLSE